MRIKSCKSGLLGVCFVLTMACGAGQIYGWYRVNAIPNWIALGPDSKILGHSCNPSEAFQLAQKSMDRLIKS